jgi:hypothetical protein
MGGGAGLCARGWKERWCQLATMAHPQEEQNQTLIQYRIHVDQKYTNTNVQTTVYNQQTTNNNTNSYTNSYTQQQTNKSMLLVHTQQTHNRHPTDTQQTPPVKHQ